MITRIDTEQLESIHGGVRQGPNGEGCIPTLGPKIPGPKTPGPRIPGPTFPGPTFPRPTPLDGILGNGPTR